MWVTLTKDTTWHPHTVYKSKVKVKKRLWTYITCCLMVIHPYAKFGISLSKSKGHLAQITIHAEHITLILRPKIKVIQSLWIYVKHRFMWINSCAIHRMTMLKDKQETHELNNSSNQINTSTQVYVISSLLIESSSRKDSMCLVD